MNTIKDIDINKGFLLDDDRTEFLLKILEKHPVPYETFIGFCNHQIYWIKDNNYLTKSILEKYKSHLHRYYQRYFCYWWTGIWNESTKIRFQSTKDEEIIPILLSIEILEQNKIFFKIHQNTNSLYGFNITIARRSLKSQQLTYCNNEEKEYLFNVIFE